MHHNFDLLINSFIDTKIGVDPNFLSENLSTGLQKHIEKLQLTNQLSNAGIGNNQKNENLQIRSDKIYWLDKSHDNEFEQAFLTQIDEFILYMNETCYTGINGYEFHYTVYEEGSFYKRHKDQFKTDNNRKYSLINYLNKNWQDDEGGHLNIYQDNEVQKILPQKQTAVMFKSNEIEHEVTVANRERMSITGWLKVV